VTTTAHALFHPDNIARNLAHRALTGPQRLLCPANEKDGTVDDCRCQPDPETLEGVWQGAARMACARRAAGLSLSAIDRQALDRYPATGAAT
jgi:hypothetical protein